MSSVDSEVLMSCAACGASIYQEHVHRGLAGMWAGQMLCLTCLKPKREVGAAPPATENADAIPLAAVEPAAATSSPEPPPASPYDTVADEVIAAEAAAGTVSGARHVRTFHAKLSEAALRHLDEQVNAWLKAHPSAAVKFANTTVGMFEGKHSEPNLILTIFF